MKEFRIYVLKQKTKFPFSIYVGHPRSDRHPLQWQNDWLTNHMAASIPQPVMDVFAKLQKIALENNVSFEELCEKALKEAREIYEQEEKDIHNIQEFLQ